MEALSNSIVTAVRLQIVSATTPILNVLLQDGLVVSGEVMETSAGIAYLSLGGRRVPAETSVELRPGQKFKAKVERSGDSFLLRLLDDAPPEELALTTALRSVLAQDRPTGTLVARVVTELSQHATGLEPAERERVEEVLKEVKRFVLDPRAAHDPATKDGLALALKVALARSGIFHEALVARGGSSELAVALADLKSVLARALASAPEGPERVILQHALDGLEAEQLLDVARSRNGDPRPIGVPVADGSQTATAFFVVHREPERPAAEGGDEGRDDGTEPRHAVDLAVSFTNLGPVRAEFRLHDGRLGVRFVVADPDVAARIERDVPVLGEALAACASVAALHVVTSAREDLAPASGPADVSFLRDHHLLDLRG